jgi:sugar lactone lactonase YvrE
LTAFRISYGLFLDALGFLYVSDCGNHRVLRFPPNSSNGTIAVIVAGTGTAGARAAMLSSPRDIFVDDDFTLYIADTYNHRIQQWNTNACFGETVAGTGTTGSSLSQLYLPMAVVVDKNKYMYITDQWNNRILRWLIGACSGECIASCFDNSAGTTADRFFYARDIGFDSQGSLYVSDSSNHRVQKFSLNTSASKKLD